MLRCTKLIAALVVAGALASGAALAQSTPPAKAPPPTKAAPTTTTEKVKEISRREWNKLKVQWAKEKDKWASCRKQARDQKLRARKRWTFISVCMTQ